MRTRVRSFFSVMVVATVCALAVRLFLLEDYRIVSDSMIPSLLTGDLVFVSKYSFNIRLPFSTYEIVKLRRPASGEVVAFTLPDHGLETYVKRVAAVEGDRVEIKNSVLLVNGKEMKREKAPQIKDYGPVDIPKGHFFALGDNWSDSVDSRVWGPVPYSCLKGRVSLVWLSLSPGGGVRTERLGKIIN